MTPVFDQWMNLCGVSGIALYLFMQWYIMRGLASRRGAVSRALRLIAVAMISAPLFFTWHLNNNQLVIAGLAVAVAAGIYMRRRRSH